MCGAISPNGCGQTEPGQERSAAHLLPVVYDELRRLAAARLGCEPAERTLQPTALVHEAWLRLGHGRQQPWANRAHFFAAAAECMRRILIDQARTRRARRHGGHLHRVPEHVTDIEIASPEVEDEELLLVNEALDALSAIEPRKAELVKQKYFVGLSLEDAADLLGISHRTAHRDWAYARAWLFDELRRLRGEPRG